MDQNKIHLSMLATIFDVINIDDVTDKVDVSVEVLMTTARHDVIYKEGFEDIVLINLINGMADSFDYLMTSDASREQYHLEHIVGYLQDISDLYKKEILKCDNVWVDDPELMELYATLIDSQKKTHHQEVA